MIADKAISAEVAASAKRRSPSGHTRAIAVDVRNVAWRHVLLIVSSVVMLVPLAWVLSTSLKASGREFVFPPQWIPSPLEWQNYPAAFNTVPFALYFRNSVIIAGAATLGSVLTASWAAFSFARLRFPGRDIFFGIALSTMMVPYVVTLIPTFIIFRELNWINTFLPLIVPAWLGGGGFNIFLLRQFYKTLPRELDDAARVDGANEFWIWAHIVTPLSKPALATVAMLAFIFHWNDFLAPLIYLNSPNNFTLSLGLASFQNQYGGLYNLMMAAAVMMIVPVMIVFFTGLRFFMQGIALTGFAGR